MSDLYMGVCAFSYMHQLRRSKVPAPALLSVVRAYSNLISVVVIKYPDKMYLPPNSRLQTITVGGVKVVET